MPATAAEPAAQPAGPVLSTAAEAILAEAFRLPEEDRLALADRLLRLSADALETHDRREFSAAERAELERRVEDFHAGRETGEPWPEARARAHALIAELSAEERSGGDAAGAA